MKKKRFSSFFLLHGQTARQNLNRTTNKQSKKKTMSNPYVARVHLENMERQFEALKVARPDAPELATHEQTLRALRADTAQTLNAEIDDVLKSIAAAASFGDTTALHMAGGAPEVKILVDAGANIEARDWTGRTPFLRAVERRNFVVAKALVAHGADRHARDAIGRNAFFYTQCRHSVKALAKMGGIDINAKDGGGITPVYYHTALGNDSVVVALLDAGAHPIPSKCDNMPRSQNEGERNQNKAALEAATADGNVAKLAQCDHFARVNALLLNGVADVRSVDSFGNTILFLDEERIKAWIDMGADLETKNCNGQTALEFWMAKGKRGASAAVELLKAGAAIRDKAAFTRYLMENIYCHQVPDFINALHQRKQQL